MSDQLKYYVAFVLTIYVAFLLTTLPMPFPLNWLRPSWVVLVLMFWLLQAPSIFGVFTGVVCGVVFDVLVGAPLGLHGLTMSVVAFVTLLMQKRMRFFNLWQQSGMIFVLAGTERLLAYWVSIVVGDASGFSLWPALSSVVIWLPLSIALSGFQRLFHLRSV